MTNIFTKTLKTLLLPLVAGLLFILPAQAQEGTGAADDDVVNLDELLETVRQGIQTQTREFQEREAEFLSARNRQSQLLAQARTDKANEERRSVRLENQYNTNERRITELTTQLREKLGNLNEVFGVLQQVAGDTRSLLQGSHVSIQFPGRDVPLTALIQKAAEGTDLPTIEEIEGLWYIIQQEMTESGKISTFTTQVAKPDGPQETIELTRIGDFNIVSDGKYYVLDDSGKVSELSRQPAGRYTGTIDDLLEAGNSEIVSFGIDPSRGQILNVYVTTPSLMDQVHQGKLIGYLILAMGAIGMLFVFERFFYLFLVGRKVNAQAKNAGSPNTGNPLGRVLQVYSENKDVDVETLELKLDEAILKETPKLERFLTIIKLISAVAPLFGLLGTVTGMIVTFQAITLFGTGDPKLMAGGISQALVTTVLGLVVAIPTLLLHSVVAGMSKRIVHVLEEQSAGLIAEHAEKGA